MNNKFQIFIRSILAGICIGIGCNIYLSCDNRYIGAALFSVGLISIITFDFNLYTGKVGYIVTNGIKFTVDVFIILLGNIVGCILLGMLFPSELAAGICFAKLSTDLLIIFYKSIMCGILMFVAVDSYTINKNFILTFLCIPTFILSGYEHSIADIIYFIMGRILTLQTAIFIVVAILGNAIGGMIIPICRKINNNNTKLIGGF